MLTTQETQNQMMGILLDGQFWLSEFPMSHQHSTSLHRRQIPVSEMDCLRYAREGENGLGPSAGWNRLLCIVKFVEEFGTFVRIVVVLCTAIVEQSAQPIVHEEVDPSTGIESKNKILLGKNQLSILNLN